MNVCLTGSDLKLGIFVVYLSNKEFGSQGGPLLWLASRTSFLELMIAPVEADSHCGSVPGLWVVQ